jgi:hypothetical protein
VLALDARPLRAADASAPKGVGEVTVVVEVEKRGLQVVPAAVARERGL